MAETILPLATRAMGTLQDMGGTIRLSPLCHESAGAQHEIRGWVLELAGSSHASTMPIPHNLFHGVSVALCESTEEEIFELMRDGDGTRTKISKAVDQLMAKSKDEKIRATWKRCRPRYVPMSLHSAQRDTSSTTANNNNNGVIMSPLTHTTAPLFCAGINNNNNNITFSPSAGVPAVIDGEPWEAELSPDGFIGLYFSWGSDQTIQLYVACQSYLPKACLDFSTLVHCAVDDKDCKADMVCLSVEAQWLRGACERNRARIIAEVCASIGVRVPTVDDYRATQKHQPMALVISETLHHDLLFSSGMVRVLNYCSDARTAFNGSICVMSPWEGVWVFRGGGDSVDHFFGLPHNGKAGVVLPTASPRVLRQPTGGSFFAAAKTNHLSFTSANTYQCKALSVWGGKPKHLAVTLKPEPIFAFPRQKVAATESNIMEAYERSIAMSALPMTVIVPNHVLSEEQQHYLQFDEHVLDRMARLGWNRSHGIAKLSPIACALFEHWKALA